MARAQHSSHLWLFIQDAFQFPGNRFFSISSTQFDVKRKFSDRRKSNYDILNQSIWCLTFCPLSSFGWFFSLKNERKKQGLEPYKQASGYIHHRFSDCMLWNWIAWMRSPKKTMITIPPSWFIGIGFSVEGEMQTKREKPFSSPYRDLNSQISGV